MSLRSLISVGLVLALCFSTACTTNLGSRSRRGSESEKRPRKSFVLDRIEVDQEVVKKGGKLVFNEPAPQREQGLSRQAAGYFSVSDRGFCRSEVAVGEPAIGLDGRPVRHRYEILSFNGAISEDGDLAETHTGTGASLLQPEKLRLKIEGGDMIWVQPFHDGQLSPYRFRFNRTLVDSIGVAMPWK